MSATASTSASSSVSSGPDSAVRLKKRKANFTFSEVHILLDEVRKNRHIVVGKFNSGIPSDIKRRKWTEITQRINVIGECDREVGEVIKKWSDLKCDTKRKIAAIHSGAALPYSPDLSQTENIVSSILELDKKPWEATRSSRGRSKSEEQDTAAGDEDDDVTLMGLGSVQDSPRSGIETKPVLPPLPAGGLEMKFESLVNTDAESRAMDSDDDHHDLLPSSMNNSYTEDEGTVNSFAHVSSSSTGHAQAGAESESAREQLAQSASLSVQEQHMTNALLCTVSRSLELLAESVQQLAETQQEFARESLRLQRETVQVLREFASGALTILHERVNGKPPIV
ncbi:Nuclear apoptosis-inducing factor 1 [Bagarius yarrelli]|uniref:Nuclear apoptosis-inducing factor 1 n=1 Tax=Bagarius yarrelli TaxID=175774 RepID=A0A556UEP8_BAGYA|nr:Nuclear apoptosis-inducing factor 1 [Bagarius yarrelli]